MQGAPERELIMNYSPNTALIPPESSRTNNGSNNTPHYFMSIKTDSPSCVLTLMKHEKRSLLPFPYFNHGKNRPQRSGIPPRSNFLLDRVVRRHPGTPRLVRRTPQQLHQFCFAAAKKFQKVELGSSSYRTCTHRIFTHGVVSPLFPSFSCLRHSSSETLSGRFKLILLKTHNAKQSRFFAVDRTTLSRQKKQNQRSVVFGKFWCSANKPNITQTLNPPGTGSLLLF